MCDAFPQHSRFLAERLRHFEAQLDTAIRRNFSSLSCAPPVWHVRLQLCSNHSSVAELGGDGLHAAHQFKALLLVKAFRKERRRLLCKRCGSDADFTASPILTGSCMQLFLSFNDWTITHTRAMQALLPLGEMCTVPSATGGIPVPDWTFTQYPNINVKWEGTKDSSWEQMWSTLQHQFEHQTVNDRDEVVRWRGRKSQPVFWLAAPLEYRIRRSIAGTYFLEKNDSLAALGLRNDVKIEKDRLSWRDMCRARYQLHVDGYTNAYSLKYRLACGGTILRVQGGNWVAGEDVATCKLVDCKECCEIRACSSVAYFS
ncbi:hypothetical protein AB1Y20_021298 [Prymnesium parvum]|uniref:Glycosyl transferase CAP10 domain-containing protein n=1 Tax=Prymnesium parvum TaxID=97485 RepID=A0AB34JLL7_PRYPA